MREEWRSTEGIRVREGVVWPVWSWKGHWLWCRGQTAGLGHRRGGLGKERPAVRSPAQAPTREGLQGGAR